VRIASVSDLHTDFRENRDAVVALASAIAERGAELVIVAGDVSHDNDRIRRVLRAFKAVAPEVAYVPGNHDVWFEVPFAPARPDLDAWVRYRRDLRALAEGEGAHYLPAAPLVLGGVGIAGSCGWYDYRFLRAELRDQLGPSFYEDKEFEGMVWADARRTVFRDAAGRPMHDPDIARVMLADLEAQLRELEARDDVRDVVAVTHHLAFEVAVKMQAPLPWALFNAFMGSPDFGEAILRCRKVRAAVYGHTHFVGDYVVDGVRVVGTPLGYPRERRGASMETIVDSRIAWIEL
jgi:3',5'-cyclic AMP phosphodiesterase CpdA